LEWIFLFFLILFQINILIYIYLCDPSASPSVAPANSPFLKSSVHYQLPSKFDCNVLDNVMAFVTLPVVRKSIQEQAQMHETLRHFSREDSGVELHSNSESPVEEDPDGELSDSKADISETCK